MINRTLQRQLKEWERLNEKDQLLNPNTRASYFRRKREKEEIERLSKEFNRRHNMFG